MIFGGIGNDAVQVPYNCFEMALRHGGGFP
jgi:hypothetical protein